MGTRLDALKLAIADDILPLALPAGIVVLTAEQGDKTPNKAVVLGDTDFSRDDWSGAGNRVREQTYSIKSSIWVRRSGSTEADARAVRAEAFTVLNIVEEALRTNPHANDTTGSMQLQIVAVVEGALPEDRYCEVDFVIRAEDRLVSP